MRFLIRLSIACVILGLAAGGTAWAVRCGDALVGVGSTMEEVLASCGEPREKKVLEQHKGGSFRYDRLHRGTSLVEYWHYDLGGGMITIMKFLDGKVVKVKRIPKWIRQGETMQRKDLE